MIIHTSNNDYMLVTIPDGTKVAILGKQLVIVHYLLKLSEDTSSPIVMTRGKLRDELSEFHKVLKKSKNNELAYIVSKLKTMFNGRGEFSNSIKSLVTRNIIEERPLGKVRKGEIQYRYKVKPFTVDGYVLYDHNNTTRSKSKESLEKQRIYKKEYNNKNKESINRKRRIKYALNRLKNLEKDNKKLAKTLEKVNKLKELARIKEANKIAAIEKRRQKEFEKETKKQLANTKKVILRNYVALPKTPTVKPVVVSDSSSTVNGNKNYQPYQVSNKHKVHETYTHGNFKPVAPNAKTMPNRELKRRYVTKEMIAKGKSVKISPFELEGLIKDYINKGNKIKVYDQVSEDIKAVIKGPDRKLFVSK